MRAWADRQDAITGVDGQGDDIVVWVQFGLQHVVRTEDWPVMPVEVLSVSLKPANFFEKNPSMDVPPSEQRINKSVEVGAGEAEKHLQGSVEGTVDGCCSTEESQPKL